MHEPVYPVFLDAWQFQCCGNRFDVGHEVAWKLQLKRDSTSSDEFSVTLSGNVFDVYRRAPDAPRTPNSFIIVGGLSVALPHNEEPPWKGVLLEDHHGEISPWVPATSGAVVRMFVWGADLRVDQHGASQLPGRYVTREIDRYPDGFSTGTRDGTTIRGHEEGVLAHLLVP
jgi:uncharacterized protein DUF6578